MKFIIGQIDRINTNPNFACEDRWKNDLCAIPLTQQMIHKGKEFAFGYRFSDISVKSK
jgi:hypothetical protein